MTNGKMLACSVLSAIYLSACAGLAETDDSDEDVIAMFEGRSINLAESWEDASACIVWTENGIAECFRTEEQLEQRESELEGMLVAAKGGNSGATDTHIRVGTSNLFENEDFNAGNPGKHLNLMNFRCQSLRALGMATKKGKNGKPQLSSVLNLTSTTVEIYSGVTCNDRVLPFRPNEFTLNLADIPLKPGKTWNDAALSHRRLR
jgi:hypothetical protein